MWWFMVRAPGLPTNPTLVSSGERGETLALSPGDAQTDGGDSCAWQVIGSTVVEERSPASPPAARGD